MPSLKDATAPRDMSKYVPVQPAQDRFMPSSDAAQGGGNLSLALAPVPSILGETPDTQRQYYRGGVSQYRMLPLPNAAAIAAGSTAQSQIIFTANPSGGSVFTSVQFKTNNVLNPSQLILNLEQGVGISLVSDSVGDVTIAGVVFGASGTGHSSGDVPDPGATPGTTKFLREDATWDVPSFTTYYQTIEQAGSAKPQESALNFLAPITATDNSGNGSTDIAVPVFVGSGASHAVGLVPDPGASAGTTKFLREDATWDLPPGGTGTAVSLWPSPTFLGGDVPVSSGVTTAIMTLSMTMPSSGGPFRLLVSYSAFWTTIASNTQVNFWVSDGVNAFGTTESGGGTSPVPKSGNSCSQFTPVTYANSASVTLTLYCLTNQNITVRMSPTNGTTASTLQAAALSSV